MHDEFSAQVDPRWLKLMSSAREWLSGPLGQLLLEQERLLIDEELKRHFGSYLVHYGPHPESPANCGQLRHRVRIGPPLGDVDIVCEEGAWPLGEHAADVVLLQHGLDFSLAPHRLLREAALSVRPGGHLVVVGINPWSLWGVRHYLARDALRKARCFGAHRVADWLSVLGFALEKRRFGCYRPPLSSPKWQQRLAWMEQGEAEPNREQAAGAGFYLLSARKLMFGMRPAPQVRREPRGKLLPMPVAKISRRESSESNE
ncbi:methyltransferase domain-containing protein [Pseudomonas oryzihabitans]|uniref:SAM-dependent methyltransferase n=1 Tax=Pseudomonas oryzihabitans TaxID=47885 RepID=A0A0U4XTK9_9PSED|nr:methyltransferase domain-containing protein [Pseudomonas oryzihabitans]ALZ84681.1 SAM-dependent methyltransferase [Pseudomonas oryzihabitans]HAC68063.1 methyltransferase domain-containing protein [Pseudomonas sp.]